MPDTIAPMAKCVEPVRWGLRAGLPATGTAAGYSRHKRAGEPACLECLASVSASGVLWNKAHPEQRRAAGRRWKMAHPDYVSPNIERHRERHRRWYHNNRVQEAAKFRVWREANLEVMAAHQRLRRARQAGVLTILFSQEQLAAKMSYWGDRCWMCHGAFQVPDHVKPIVRGGPHILANLRPACVACNSSKRATWPYADVLRRIQEKAA